MFAEVVEWEAKGDGLRKAGRLDDAVEAYRRALRSCFQWAKGDGVRACEEIREKIWAVQLDQFESLGGEAPTSADAVEWKAARCWAGGQPEQAECVIEAASARGSGTPRSSGEFLDRLAARWIDKDPEGSLRLTVWACRLRGESANGAHG